MRKISTKWILAVPLMALLVIGAYSMGLVNSVSVPAKGGIDYGSNVCVDTIRADGTVEHNGCSHNTLNNTGKNVIMGALAMGVLNLPVNITVGNYTQAGVWTPQRLVGFKGVNGTVSRHGTVAGNWSVSTTFTATGTARLNHTRLYASGNDTVFAYNNFTTTVLQANDQLKINWSVYIV
jgi:hypothetical protein